MEGHDIYIIIYKCVILAPGNLASGGPMCNTLSDIIHEMHMCMTYIFGKIRRSNLDVII